MGKFKIKKVFLNRELIRFAVSGGTAFFTTFILLFIFADILGLWYLLSSSLAFAVAVFVNFFMQKFWAFNDKSFDKARKQFFLFLMVNLINLLLNGLGMYLLVSKSSIGHMLAQVMVSAAIAAESFLTYKLLVFPARGESQPAVDRPMTGASNSGGENKTL